MEKKRIKALRKNIIKIVPKFPNNKDTKFNLESKHLVDLLIVYLNWASRLITQRVRKIEVEPEVIKDSRWPSLKNNFASLKEKIVNGEDLTPHLSLKAQEKGYSPSTSESSPDVDRWADKDFLLNIMGFYHFHLGEINSRGKNISKRSDELIFARVDRFVFRAIGIFDHSVFEKTDTITNEMSLERSRLWEIFDKSISQGAPIGSVVIPAMITTSGHTLQIVRLAQDYFRIINEIEDKLDDRAFVNSLYIETNIIPPKNPKLNWTFRGTDLGILDKSNNLYFVFKYGIN